MRRSMTRPAGAAEGSRLGRGRRRKLRLESLEDRSLLSIFTVNSTGDGGDTNPGDGVAVADSNEFVGYAPPVAVSGGALSLDWVAKQFDWRSDDSVFGRIDLNSVTTTLWRSSGVNPQRLVFRGAALGISIVGDVLFEPYSRGVMDVIRSSQRVRYLVTGASTLRAAIDEANALAGADSIHFRIPQVDGDYDALANVWSIEVGEDLGTALPTITEPVSIDGTTQPGFSGLPLVEVTGDLAGSDANGLQISAGSSTVRGLVINDFGGAGILMDSADGNVVDGNFLGTSPQGNPPQPNKIGVLLNNVGNNLIGTTAGNLISGNTEVGVHITGPNATGNRVQRSFIGTNRLGTAELGNGTGVRIDGKAHDNIIGTDGDGANDVAEGNLISGNKQAGVSMSGDGTSANVVAGNLIGTKEDGEGELANLASGVEIIGKAKLNRVGTDGNGQGDAAERNVISGNKVYGVHIAGVGTDGNIVAGNLIGTERDGEAEQPNVGGGVAIFMARSNRIGTNGDSQGDAAERNLISGNGATGVLISGEGAEANIVAGNLIGTRLDGKGAIPNQLSGVFLRDKAKANRIGTNSDGTSDVLERNIISGNKRRGVGLMDAGTDENIVAGNYIGLQIDGATGLGNEEHGVFIDAGAGKNRIGSNVDGTRDAEEANLIAFNGGDGVFVTSGEANPIRRNSIFENKGLGIDLGPDGVTTNDAKDADVGANKLQNYPVITLVTSAVGKSEIKGTLHSAPNTRFRVELFSNTKGDPSGFGEGQKFLDAVDVTTDKNGDAAFTKMTDAGQTITATATDPDGNTSEFSSFINLALIRDAANDKSVDDTDPTIGFAEIGHFGNDTVFAAGSAGGAGKGVDGYAADGNVRNAAGDTFVDRDPDRFHIRVTDPLRNTNPAAREEFKLKLGTFTDNRAINDDLTEVLLRETGNNTGVFVSQSMLLMTPDLPQNADDDFAVHDGIAGAVQDDAAGDRTHRTTIDGRVTVEYDTGKAVLETGVPVSNRDPEQRRILRIRAHVFNEPPGVDISGDGVINTVLGTKANATAHVNAQIERSTIAWAPAAIKVELESIVFENAPNDAKGKNIIADKAFDIPSDAQDVFNASKADLRVDRADIFFVAPIGGANAIAYPPAHNAAVPGTGFNHDEFSFAFIAPNLDLRFRTVAHELGHLLVNGPDSNTPNHVYFPSLTGIGFGVGAGNAKFDFVDGDGDGKHAPGERSEIYSDLGYDDDGKAATPPVGAGNGRFDFTDNDKDGVHDPAEPSEPFEDQGIVVSDHSVSFYRRITRDTESNARAVRPAGNLGATGNRMLQAPAPLKVGASAPIDDGWHPLAADSLDAIVGEAMARWASVGVASDLFADIRFSITELAGGVLSETFGREISIDQDAAGFGWFADPSPADDSEFTAAPGGSVLAAPNGSPAYGRMDLLTAVMHELAHVLGFADLDDGTRPDQLMTPALLAGQRRLLTAPADLATLVLAETHVTASADRPAPQPVFLQGRERLAAAAVAEVLRARALSPVDLPERPSRNLLELYGDVWSPDA